VKEDMEWSDCYAEQVHCNKCGVELNDAEVQTTHGLCYECYAWTESGLSEE